MTLETERLLLREHQRKDFDRFWEMLRDPIAKQYTGGVTTVSYEQRLAVYKKDCEAPFTEEQSEFAVTDKASGIYLGYCGFMPAQEIEGSEFFHGLCRDSWGKGYGYEAAAAALTHFFKNTKHDSFVATVVSQNTGSIKILQKLGFRKTGTISNSSQGNIECYEITKPF